MKETARQCVRFGVAIFATAIVALGLAGQASSPRRTSLVTDWSSKHLIFSTPTTREGLSIASRDIRYQQQWTRRNMHPAPPRDGEGADGVAERQSSVESDLTGVGFRLGSGRWGGGSKNGNGKLKRDWASSLGPGSTAGVDAYPAKFNFDTTTASCANDFVVFGTSVTGAAAGASAKATGSFTGVPTNGQTATITYGTAVDTVTATAAVKASTSGTFSGAPPSGQTVVIMGASNATFTAEDNTAATGSFTVAGAFCVAPGQGVTINGQSLTTNATKGSGLITITGNPTGFTSGTTAVTVGSVTYTFVTGAPDTGSATAVQVHYSTFGSSSQNEDTAAQNLEAAINANGGECVTGGCFSSAAVANAVGTATLSSNAVTVTPPCAGALTAPTFSDNSANISTAWTVGGDGTTSGTNFALAASGAPTATTVAAQIAVDVNTNTAATTVSATSSAGAVNLKANTWGTTGNSITLAENATSGVSRSGATLTGGANAAVSGNQFRVDNNTTDEATALATAIVAGGGPAGVTASSAGAVVTITATAAGSAGNSISITDGLTGFSVTSPLSGGASLNGATGFFAVTNADGSAITGGTTTIAANFATAVAAEGTASGVPVTATSSGSGVTVTSSAPGSLGNGVVLGESLSNFTWSGGALTGGAGQASIVAYNNLYSSCGGTVPTTLWSYFTNGTVQTSPTLSLDGTQVAFVQSSSGGVASLVLLKWTAGSGVTAGSPVTLTTTTASAYPSCTAPCMLELTFNSSPNDTNSSPYYDYSSDTIYVGDDNGSLHKFTPVFGGGAPAEITTSPWPVALTNSAGRVTTSPVAVSGGSVYIGTARTGFGGSTGGYLYAVNESTGAQTASSEIATTPGIADAPIVDPTAGMVYVFASSDNTFFTCGGFSGCNGVYQFTTNFAAGNSGNEQTVGAGGSALFTGDFDNIYFTASSSTSPTGSLYVCGDSGGHATIYRIPITSNSMGTAVAGPVLTSATATCSPITEADNGSTDLIFVNVEASGSPAGCSGGGCVMSFTVTSGTLPASTSPSATLPENGGASGMIIDTLGSGTTGSNQVYMTPIGTGQTCPSGAGCAVQASQSALN